MKKHLLALAILSSGMASAQVWSENFSSPTPPALPTGWMQNNVDGLTVASNINATWNFGTNAWVSWNFTGDPHGKVAASTSWYTPAGISNDWLITPSFTVPANSVLEWEALAVEAGFQDGYQVKLSTTGTTVPAFSTNLLTVPQEITTWNVRTLNMNAYAGQTVNIAFVNNSNDKNRLYLDNFNFFVPASEDGKVANITGLTRYMAGAGNQNITGQFQSKGFSPASTAVMNYKVNNGAVVTETITFASPLSYNQIANYAFTTQASLSLGVNKIKTWVTQVNSINEVNHLNDTAYATVYVASISKPRSVLIEEWSSSTCVPCANLNVNFDPLINSNNPNTGGDVNVVKYQVNWPAPGNDPSYNPHCLARRMHYDVNAAPTTIIDGTSEMQSHSQAEIDAAKLLPAFADITATLSANSTTGAAAGTTVVASATIIPYVTISTGSPLRVYQALVQNHYHYNSGTTTQKEYHHAMRKMDANGWGTPKTVTDGSAFTVTFTNVFSPASLDLNPTPTPAQGSYNSWINADVAGPNAPKNIVYEYVVFLQDTISNDVLQSSSWTATVTLPTPSNPVGLNKVELNNHVSIFPNPAKDYAVISLNLEKSSVVDVKIYDMAGRMVFTNTNASVDSGKNEMTINTSEFATGNYNVVIKAGDVVLKDKLIVTK
jgi:hypothetical protein